MTSPMALGTAASILAWAAVTLALVGALAAVALLYRVLQPALEIQRYSGDILDAGLAIARNVEGVEELGRTRELAAKVPGLAATFLESRGPGPP